MVGNIADLSVRIGAIPQVDTSWLGSLLNGASNALDQFSSNRSFDRLDKQFDKTGAQSAAPQRQQSFFNSLMGGTAPVQTAPVGTVDRGPAQGSTFEPFMNVVRTRVQNPFGLAAIAATGRAESGWSQANADRSWSDPSQSGQPGTAGGVMSWRGPRLASLQAYARSKGENGNGSPGTQAEFLLQEDPGLIDRLNAAQSPEEAADAMARAWQFAGFNQQGGEAARRRAMTVNYAGQFRNQPGTPAAAADSTRAAANVVASNDPSIGIPMPGATGQMRASAPAQPLDIRSTQPNAATSATSTAPAAVPPSVARTGGDVPVSVTQINSGGALARPEQQSANFDLPTSTPIQTGGAPSDMIRFMLRDPNLRQMGLELWKQNAGKAGGEPYSFSTLDDGTLVRWNKQTGAVERVGNFAKPQIPISVKDGETLLDPVTRQPIYQQPKQNFNQLTPDQVKARGLDPSKSYQVGPDQRVYQIGGEGTNVTIDNGDNSTTFDKESDKAAAKRLNDIVEGGSSAPQMMQDLQTLATLGQQIGTGKTAQVMSTLGPYAEALGISIDGLGESQAFQAITARLIPQMRPPGSGPQTDADARNLLNSIPTIGKTPEGNRIINETLQRVQENKIRAADIASKAYIPKDQGGITWQEAERQIRALANPYAEFRKYTGSNPPAQKQGAATPPLRARNPKTGETLELRNGKWESVR